MLRSVGLGGAAALAATVVLEPTDRAAAVTTTFGMTAGSTWAPKVAYPAGTVLDGADGCTYVVSPASYTSGTTSAAADATAGHLVKLGASTAALARLNALELRTPSDVVRGLPVGVVGNSYGAIARTISLQRYPEMLAARLGSDLGNLCVNGMLAHDVCSFIYGSFPKLRGDGATAPGTIPPSPSTHGIFIVEAARNDAGWDGYTGAGQTMAKARAGFTRSLRAIIALLQASAWCADTDESLSYTGSWSAQTGNAFYKDGGIHNTTTPGDKVIIALPSGTDFDVVLMGWDGGAYGIHGAAYTVKVDGVARPDLAGTTEDAVCCAMGQTSIGSQVTIPVHGLSAGKHTVEITHAGTAGAGGNLSLNGYLVRSATPATVVLPKAARLNAAGYAAFGGGGASWSTDQVYNGLIDALAAAFTDGSVVSVDPNTSGWDPTTCISAADPQQVHPGLFGYGVLTDMFMAKLNALPARAGLVAP